MVPLKKPGYVILYRREQARKGRCAMLYTQKLLAELGDKRSLFSGYQDRYGQTLAAYRAALDALGSRFTSAAALTAALTATLAHRAEANSTRGSLGARPSAEYDRWHTGAGLVVPFGATFAHHGEARAWAERLRDVTTVAVDGSQLLPWRDASVPVALVQAGIFENPHRPPMPYLKDVVTEVLSPEELLGGADDGDARTGEVYGYSEQIVHLRRFELETRVLAERMRRYAEAAGSMTAPRRVVAFSDGSLILSFALKLPPLYRDRYVGAMRALLRASEEYRVPLVGYIDTSFAHDLVTLLRGVASDAPLPEPRGVHDALLWQGRLGWGDRTPAFISARDDLARMGYDDQQNAVAFTYFQAALDRPPARLEFPRWVLEAGLLDEVMEVVSAETIAGNGYPYCLEAADAVAVITVADRAQFYALFQDFAAREGLTFTFSKKALSKSRRR